MRLSVTVVLLCVIGKPPIFCAGDLLRRPDAATAIISRALLLMMTAYFVIVKRERGLLFRYSVPYGTSCSSLQSIGLNHEFTLKDFSN
jgi:hypothetical protein